MALGSVFNDINKKNPLFLGDFYYYNVVSLVGFCPCI